MGLDGTVLRIADAAPSRPRLSPLARGIGYRLGWAAGLSALLWLAVFWALS
jgi:hypothetical protein